MNTREERVGVSCHTLLVTLFIGGPAMSRALSLRRGTIINAWRRITCVNRPDILHSFNGNLQTTLSSSRFNWRQGNSWLCSTDCQIKFELKWKPRRWCFSHNNNKQRSNGISWTEANSIRLIYPSSSLTRVKWTFSSLRFTKLILTHY